LLAGALSLQGEEAPLRQAARLMLTQVRHGVCIFGDFGPSWGCKQLFLQGAEPQNAM
jgi:hypothetical protein